MAPTPYLAIPSENSHINRQNTPSSCVSICTVLCSSLHISGPNSWLDACFFHTLKTHELGLCRIRINFFRRQKQCKHCKGIGNYRPAEPPSSCLVEFLWGIGRGKRSHLLYILCGLQSAGWSVGLYMDTVRREVQNPCWPSRFSLAHADAFPKWHLKLQRTTFKAPISFRLSNTESTLPQVRLVILLQNTNGVQLPDAEDLLMNSYERTNKLRSPIKFFCSQHYYYKTVSPSAHLWKPNRQLAVASSPSCRHHRYHRVRLPPHL